MKNMKIFTRGNIDSNSFLELNSSWNVSFGKKPKTLQYFITSKCNLRCPDCFFADYLGNCEVSVEDYKRYVSGKVENESLEKVNILGGEPTLHKGLGEILRFNNSLGLKTHIYSNGARLNKMKYDLHGAKIRLSILSFDRDKPITKINTGLPLTIVYPLKKDNLEDVTLVLDYCKKLNVSEFVFSTIKKLDSKEDFFDNKRGCLTTEEYIDFLNSFFKQDSFSIGEYHINSRGIFDLGNDNCKCNFTNKLVSGSETNCPFDIDIGNFSDKLISFGKDCSKNDVCLLEKIIVERGYE